MATDILAIGLFILGIKAHQKPHVKIDEKGQLIYEPIEVQR